MVNKPRHNIKMTIVVALAMFSLILLPLILAAIYGTIIFWIEFWLVLIPIFIYALEKHLLKKQKGSSHKSSKEIKKNSTKFSIIFWIIYFAYFLLQGIGNYAKSNAVYQDVYGAPQFNADFIQVALEFDILGLVLTLLLAIVLGYFGYKFINAGSFHIAFLAGYLSVPFGWLITPLGYILVSQRRKLANQIAKKEKAPLIGHV